MKIKSMVRLEWISLVYLGLFVLAVLSPSLVQKDFFGIQERHVEEVLIFIFGVVGLSIFSLYQRLIERHEREHEDAKNDYDRAKRELVESYKYIGSINRQIEVLKSVTNQTSLSIVESDHLAKDILSSIIASAAASVGASSALIRGVELDKLRTEYELYFPDGGDTSLKISNKDLFKVHETKVTHAFINSDDGREVLVVPSDRHGKDIKSYLLMLMPEKSHTQMDPSLLKVFVNQAELLRHALVKREKTPSSPIELIKETERQVVGEVG
jgi:hypothetical protein